MFDANALKAKTGQFENVGVNLKNVQDTLITHIVGFTPKSASVGKYEIDNKTFYVAKLEFETVSLSDTNLDDGHTNEKTTKNFLKFPYSYLESQGITLTQFKEFFDMNFVKAKRIVLPAQRYKSNYQSGSLVDISYEIDDTFNLSEMFDDFNKNKKNDK